MGNSKAIGRRGRVLRRANERAQRRFHAMFDAHVWADPFARATQLYGEADRLVRQILGEPEPPGVAEFYGWPVEKPSRPAVQLEDILRGLRYEDRADEYRTRGA